MPDLDVAWLVEIETATADIKTFTANIDRSSFLSNRIVCSATAMQLIVIGEAAGKLSETTKDEAPEIPWPKIITLRHRIAHGYRSIDHQIVWDIVEEHIPQLKDAVQRLLAARGELGP